MFVCFYHLQLNPDVNVFQRKFVNEVRRCEEMDRKLSEWNGVFTQRHTPTTLLWTLFFEIDSSSLQDLSKRKLRRQTSQFSTQERTRKSLFPETWSTWRWLFELPTVQLCFFWTSPDIYFSFWNPRRRLLRSWRMSWKKSTQTKRRWRRTSWNWPSWSTFCAGLSSFLTRLAFCRLLIHFFFCKLYFGLIQATFL